MNNRYRGLARNQDGEREEAEINLAPMIDILFILLIFFLVTTSFVRDSGVDVKRPNAVSAERIERSAILVAIRSDGEIWIDRRPVDIRRIVVTVGRLHAQSPEAPVVVQADESAEVGLLVRVMDQIRLAGIGDIAVAAEVP